MECCLKKKLIGLKKARFMDMTAQMARRAAAEGVVLLKNRGNVLPLKSGEKIALFGRCQIDYNSGGTGSGGSVNAPYITNITDALREKDVIINEELAQIYEEWTQQNPIVSNLGQWASRPLHQKEMTVSYELACRAAETSDTAIIIIGRTAGEEQDNSDIAGSFRLTADERRMLRSVTGVFKHTVVLLNTSNIIDMKWEEEFDVDAIAYIWQGGQEGGRGAADVLVGEACPSGRLTDTIARSYSDYPSAANFGSSEENNYAEGIYVGYRHFETFAENKVVYPFGYGLSYTEFSFEIGDTRQIRDSIDFSVEVKNVGSYPGAEVVQIYIIPPNSEILRPRVTLVDFAKTWVLQPGESEKLNFSIPIKQLAVYDENASAWIIEPGSYTVTVSHNIRDLNNGFVYEHPGLTTKPIDRSHLFETYAEIPLTGDMGYKLADIKKGKVSADDFIAQLTVDDLISLTQGEGMGSDKVRPGTGAAFGGVTERLRGFGIPAVAATDGPSGLRFDNGDKATMIPIGTMLASTWNRELVQELYSCIAREMKESDVDLLLGPGMNIHRDPLCGRNFEYFSEDPLISGAMAAAAINGLRYGGAEGTLKHFAANNQEFCRRQVNSVVSERALREIYLKGLEYAIELSKPKALMTAYNPLNGVQCGSNNELISLIRNEYGFEGMIMTDWWAELGSERSRTDRAAMLRAGGDIYMVVPDAANTDTNNIKQALKNKELTLGALQSAAKNLVRFILALPAADKI